MADARRGIHRVKRPGSAEDFVLVREMRPSEDFGEPDEAAEFQMPESMYRFYRIEPPIDTLPTPD